MFSRDLKYIFIHIPKSAGTSIQNALLQIEGQAIPHELAENETEQNLLLSKYLIHTNVRHKKLEFIISENKINFSDYFIFTFVRNPFSRLVSSYCYHSNYKKDLPFLYSKSAINSGNDYKRNIAYRLLATAKSNNVVDSASLISSFKNFVVNFDYQLLNTQIYRLQSDYFTQRPEFDENKSEFSKYGYDFVGRFENLDHDWQYVIEKISGKQIRLDAHNQTIHPNYEAFYDAEIERKVREIYKKDFELLGY